MLFLAEQNVHSSYDVFLQCDRNVFRQIEKREEQVDELFEKLKHPQSDLVQWHSRIAALEQKIDDITGLYRSHMFERMKNSQCSFEGNLLLSEMLTDFERIGDHALNIADELLHVLS